MKSSAAAEARGFLGHLWGGDRQGVAFLTGEALRWGKLAFNLADDDALDRIAAEAVRLGDVRATVAIFRDGSSRQSWNVLRARAAMVDFDGGEQLDDDTLPSLMVASGGSSNGRRHFHGLWLLGHAVDGRELAEVQVGLRDNLGGDPKWTAAASALIRIPGTEHRKAGKLRRVELERSNDHRFDFTDLRRSNPPRSKPTATPILPADELPADLSSAVAMACSLKLAEVERGELPREPTGFALICESKRQGASQDQTTSLLREHYWQPVQSIRRDHNYFDSDLLGSIRRAYRGSDHGSGRGSGRECRAFDPGEVRAWRDEALRDSLLSDFERQMVIELARRMLGAGSMIVTASARSLALALSCQLKTITRAINGCKRFAGLWKRWIRKARRGEDGAQRWGIRRPDRKGGQTASASAIRATSHPSSPVNCSHVFIPSHDAFAFHALGQSIRSTLSVLAGFHHPVSIAELAASPLLHRSSRTLRRHLRWAERFELASISGSQFRAELDDLDSKLDRVARDLGTAGLRDRLRRRFAVERDQDRKRRAAFGERCAEERERRTRVRLRRRGRARRRRRILKRFDRIPA